MSGTSPVAGNTFPSASLIGSVIIYAVKFISLRARPYAGMGPYSFFNPAGFLEDARAFQSFPSGDVGIIAGPAAYFFFQIQNRGIRWLIWLFPLSTALSRVTFNKHWPSDTFSSFIFSILTVVLIWGVSRGNQVSSRQTLA